MRYVGNVVQRKFFWILFKRAEGSTHHGIKHCYINSSQHCSKSDRIRPPRRVLRHTSISWSKMSSSTSTSRDPLKLPPAHTLIQDDLQGFVVDDGHARYPTIGERGFPYRGSAVSPSRARPDTMPPASSLESLLWLWSNARFFKEPSWTTLILDTDVADYMSIQHCHG